MAAGGKKKTETQLRKGKPGGYYKGPPKPRTAFEQTSPKSATALRRLEAKQEELAARNMLRDELGSKLDDPSFRVEMDGKEVTGLKKGGKVRGCGVAQRGLTKGRMV